MVPKFEAMWYADISELRKQRNSLVEKCTHLSDKFQQLSAEHEKKDKKLTRLKREFIVVERQIKDAQSDIYQINNKLSEIDETAYSFLKEFESKETELAELNNLKPVLETDIDVKRNDLQEISKELTVIETEITKDAQQAAQLLEEKRKMSDDVSKYLSKTSLEKEQVEEKFNGLNRSFLQSMDEREAVKKQLNHLRTTVKMLPERVEELKQQVELLEEVKVLLYEMTSIQAEVANNEKKFLAMDSKLKDRQTAFAEKKDKLDPLLAENTARKEKIDSLEKEVKVYSKILSVFATAKENFDISRELFEQGADMVMEALSEKVYLEKHLKTIWEETDILKKIETELTS